MIHFARKPRAVTCFVKHLVTDKTQSRSLSAVAAQGNSAANITSGCSKATGTQCSATLLAAITVHAHQILEVESSLCDITEGPGSWCLLLVSILELGVSTPQSQTITRDLSIAMGPKVSIQHGKGAHTPSFVGPK